MPWLDDNNTAVPSGFGKDPLAELDEELERLREQMGETTPDKPTPSEPAARARRAGRIPALMLALVLLAGVLSACGSASSEPEPATVTVSDPELGTIEIQPPSDATVNSYDAANLTLDDSGYYTYTVDGKKVSEMGVDLSEYQGEVDFEQVKASGIDFVMLRIGGRTYGSGTLYADDAFDGYYQQAKAAGLKVGAYFFSQAITKEEGVEEARYVLSLLNGRALDYPVAIDWETIDDDEARTDGIDAAALTALAAGFCDAVEAAGYRSLVYASTSLILQTYDFNVMKDYSFWLADYREMPEQDAMYYRYSIWQYSDSGSVPGIEGEADLNLCLSAADM